jgi:hypothetical protein
MGIQPVLHQARKPAKKSPFGKVLTLVVLLAIVYAAVSSGFVERAYKRLSSRKPDHHDVERAANILKDTPECARYRAAILKFKGQPTSSERVAIAIDQALDEGIAAGCRKSDLSE